MNLHKNLIWSKRKRLDLLYYIYKIINKKKKKKKFNWVKKSTEMINKLADFFFRVYSLLKSIVSVSI